MRPFRGLIWLSSLVSLAASALPLQAGWDSVFQVTCWGCRHKAPAAVSYYAAPASCCAPAPCQSCVSYVQRCYYQPMTHYESRSYYESVTSYRTSYYYEPVTTYTYSSYFDACSCSYKQTACPTTCYQLRAQTCPVQNWVQRCYSVPVTTYQQSFYWEQVPTCAPTVAAAPPPSCCGTPAVAAAPAPLAPAPAPAAAAMPPAVSEPRIPAPGVTEGTPRPSTDGGYNRYYPPVQQPADSMPRASGTSSQQPLPQQPAPLPPVNQAPNVRLERVVNAPIAEVHGQVVHGPDLPMAGARILFVNAERNVPRQATLSDGAGTFHVALSSGGWLIYVDDADGHPVFQKKIQVQEQQAYLVSLAMR